MIFVIQKWNLHLNRMEKSEVFEVPFLNHENHVILQFNNKSALLDTGSPLSVGGGSFDLAGRTFKTLSASETRHADINTISKFVGCHLDYLIGNDILSQFCVSVSFKKSIVTFSEKSFPFDKNEAKRIPLKYSFMIPEVSYEICGEQMTAFVDTGAPISYIKSSIAEFLLETEEVMKDFSPHYGEWTTKLYKGWVMLGENSFLFKFGVLPAPLEGLMLSKNSAILGSDLFNSCQYVGFDVFQEQTMYLVM
eukprot:TRINITY_DN4869_c0_g1_i1.p1 TRINITY_DN4869_c0_g1~~TRINITY_DN4869_c0_g1_i1.p1  ORF type:complete len:250 (-),score=13.10 TRINITY_DN4869_c0_g1_i1:108-857(-)